jgi:hypothetical protein
VATAATVARRTPLSARSPRGWALAGGACIVLAALSLLVARQPTYDPTAWLIWGREVAHWDLTTTFGPSWKPLPVLVTAPASVLGDAGAQQLWLVVARAAALLALVLAFDLGARLGGAAAGAIAAAGLLISRGYASRTFRGDSEGLLAALGLGAVVAHLAGRRRLAFALLVGTALLRPEMLLFAGAYGLWLGWRGEERRAVALAMVAGTGVLVVALWLVPEKLGSGELLRAATRARLPVEDSPAQAAFPFLATFTNAAPVVPWPLYVGGVALVAAAAREAWRTRRASPVLVLAVVATLIMLLVAAMAEGGFTGNSRYLTVSIGIVCVLGGAGLTRLYGLARERLSTRALAAALALFALASAPFVVGQALRTRKEFAGGLRESLYYDALPAAIEKAGGRDALLGCGRVYTLAFDTQIVAYAMHMHEKDVGIHELVPGQIVARLHSGKGDPIRFPHRTVTKRWVFARSCPPR